MITLGLDTSEAHGGAALVEDGSLLGEALMEEPLHHSEELLPLVERLISSCAIERSEISQVSVNRGPGSFTGLRIGIATAKGLSQALEIPVVGVDGTVAYRERVASARRVCVVIKSRRDLFYARWFSGGNPRGEEVEVLSRKELLARLAQGKGVTVIGSGGEELRPELERLAQVELAPRGLNRPSPEWIARLGERMRGTDELYMLEPLYVEPAIKKLVS